MRTATAALVLSVGLLAQAGHAAPASQATPVRLAAQLTCLPAGGASVTFSIANVGRRTVAIDQTFT